MVLGRENIVELIDPDNCVVGRNSDNISGGVVVSLYAASGMLVTMIASWSM